MSDARKIITARGVRSFGYGLMGVTLAVALLSRGITPVAIGLLVAVALAGDVVGTYIIGLLADRLGRRRILIWLGIAMALTGVAFALFDSYPVLLLVAFLGTLGASSSETAPFLPIEQAMLAQIIPAERRTTFFARYNLVASFALALGALAAGAPDALMRIGLPLALGLRLMFGVYALCALGVVALCAWLSPAVEAISVAPGQAAPITKTLQQKLAPPLGRSRGLVYRLAALFSVDAFAGALIGQSLMALYFHLRYGAPLATLGFIFFGSNTFSALSFLAAAPLARRFGLLNTMVFTHLPSNVLLALVPLVPGLSLAVTCLLARQALSQLDVPTRQAYTMALVAPEERTATASVTSLARSVGAAGSPTLGGALLQGVWLIIGAPFLLAGALKVAYDLTLWVIFRQVRLPIEP